MLDLYKLFQREKERVGNEFTVYFNKQHNTLQYSDDEGRLTVEFDDREKSERFFYLDLKSGKKHQGLGECVYVTADSGRFGHFADSFMELPQRFVDLAQAYQYDREAIGIDELSISNIHHMPPNKPKQNYDRDM